MTNDKLADEMCSKGHIVSEQTTYIRPSDGRRECLECRRGWNRARYAKKLPKSRARMERDARHARRYAEKYPEKAKAKRLLRSAIEAGQIARPVSCERCGTATKVQGHHYDYAKPLEVEWLCVLCHVHEHQANALAAAEAERGKG